MSRWRLNRRRLLQTALLLCGLIGIGLAVARTVNDSQEQVMPGAGALAVSGVLALVAIASSARAWVALFNDLLDSRAKRAALRGTFYLSQLAKYLPAGGVVQTASQLGLARTLGVPLRRLAIAYPVSVVCAVAAGGTLGAGLVFHTDLAAWERLLALAGLATVLLLHRGLMERVLALARRVISRIPSSYNLPSQRDILIFYAWALATLGPLCAAYAILVGSVTTGTSVYVIFCAFAVSWVIGFLVVPIPAGVGVREAVLVGLVPTIGVAPLLAASLALRLLSIAAELLAFFVNRLVTRQQGGQEIAIVSTEEPQIP